MRRPDSTSNSASVQNVPPQATVPLYPLLLRLNGRLALVVGGGRVGQHKALGLLAGGARVRLVCREQAPPQMRCAGLQWLCEEYRAEHLDGVSLAFAAATPEVNARLAADARARNLWVNDASDPESSDLFVPAVLRRGPVTVAVGSAGLAPAFSAWLRDRLETILEPELGDYASLLAEIRPLLRQRLPPASRPAAWEKLCANQWLEMLRREGPDFVRAALLQCLAEFICDTEGNPECLPSDPT